MYAYNSPPEDIFSEAKFLSGYWPGLQVLNSQLKTKFVATVKEEFIYCYNV
jgi:FPC/CPF motif-containing protein YcgG